MASCNEVWLPATKYGFLQRSTGPKIFLKFEAEVEPSGARQLAAIAANGRNHRDDKDNNARRRKNTWNEDTG
jgi:hypothetical protein